MLLDMAHACNSHTWKVDVGRLEVRSEHELCRNALTDVRVPSVCVLSTNE